MFTVRMVLHIDVPDNEYTKLHEEMAKEGFLRTITSNDGIVYDLPPVEHNKIGIIQERK